MSITVFVVARGILDGLEKWINTLMPMLFVIVLLLCLYATQSGAPDWVAYRHKRRTITNSIGINVLIHFSKPSSIPLATTNTVIDKNRVCQKINEVGLDRRSLKLVVELYYQFQ